MIFLLFLTILFANQCFGDPCLKKQFNNGAVCVCNSTYCDTVPELGSIDALNLKIYYTSQAEPGFNIKNANFGNTPNDNILTVSIKNDVHQKIIGFGAGFTDATGINIKDLNSQTLQKLLESFFGENGVEYTLMRVPIGGTEFSTKMYTIDDTDGDRDLSHLSLPYEDTVLKIPFIQRAIAMSKKPIKFIASAWTAPKWMKKPAIWTGGSVLHPDNFQVFANYHAKFFDHYQENNITFWGVTTGNEPFSGFIPYQKPLSMGWAASDQAKWLAENLAPTLKKANAYYKDIKFLIFDDGLMPLPYVVPFFLENDHLLKFIDGVATHPNWDSNMVPWIRDLAKSAKKDIFRIDTQASQNNVALGAWNKADVYIHNILELLTEYDYSGWLESNLALGTNGGPSYTGQFSDAPVIVDNNEQFFKQPIFYAIGHFSKFIIPDSARLGVSQSNNLVKSVAFLRPDGLKSVILYNSNTQPIDVQIEDHGRYSSPITLAAMSLNTILYQA